VRAKQHSAMEDIALWTHEQLVGAIRHAARRLSLGGSHREHTAAQ
jgi:hypothetical protein